MPRPVRLAAGPSTEEPKSLPGLAEAGSASRRDGGRGAAADRSSKRQSQMYSAATDYSYHRREKTKSGSYVQQSSIREESPATHAKTASGATVAPLQRIHSAPNVPRGTALSRHDEHARDNDDLGLDLGGSPGEDEEIAEDPFFQQYAAGDGGASESPTHSGSDEGIGSEDDIDGPLSPYSNTTRFRPDSVAEPTHSPLSPPSVRLPSSQLFISQAPLSCRSFTQAN